MKRVIFTKEYIYTDDGIKTNMIKYPDDVKFFSNTKTSDDGIDLIADYTGDIELTEYLDDYKQELLQECREFYQGLADARLKEFTDIEKSTFDDQKGDFRRWELDDTVPTPVVDELAYSRGVDRIVLLGKIGVNVKAQTSLVGTQQAKEDEINACATKSELDSVVIG